MSLTWVRGEIRDGKGEKRENQRQKRGCAGLKRAQGLEPPGQWLLSPPKMPALGVKLSVTSLERPSWGHPLDLSRALFPHNKRNWDKFKNAAKHLEFEYVCTNVTSK